MKRGAQYFVSPGDLLQGRFQCLNTQSPLYPDNTLGAIVAAAVVLLQRPELLLLRGDPKAPDDFLLHVCTLDF
jgi:hypothetical protein